MTLEEAISTLRINFKSHLGAADALDLSPTHYRALRNGRYPINKRTAALIMAKAHECIPQPPTTKAPAHD